MRRGRLDSQDAGSPENGGQGRVLREKKRVMAAKGLLRFILEPETLSPKTESRSQTRKPKAAIFADYSCQKRHARSPHTTIAAH